MAIDRRKSAAKRFEDDRKKKAAAAAKKAEQEKKAAAKKSQKQNKPVRSPGKDITTSVRDTFRQQAAKPQFEREQTAAQRMQGRSENWARLEAQKANADKSTRKKIEAEQDRLHKANRKDAKGMTFDSATGRWMGGGKPAYTPNVLPGMSRDAQRTGTERSLRNGIVAPDMQKAAKKHRDAVWDRVHGPETGERIKKMLSGAAGTERSLRNGIVAPDMQKAAKKHRDAVWDRVHGPETGERIKKMLSGAAKGYGSDMENFHGLAITGRGLGMEKEHAREIKVWEDEIRQWEKSLRDWEADGSLTNDERKELTDLIAANRKKIEMYEKQNRGTRAASQEVYQTADALGESGARDTQTAKRGLGAFGSAAIDVGTAGAQMLGDMALGGTPAMLMRGIGGGAKEARQSGASHMQQGAAIDVGTAGAQMLGDMALGGTPAMLMRGIGGGAKEARQSGASHMQQVNYGMLSGAASVLTEKISNVAKPLGKAFGKGAADDLIQKGIDKAVKKLAGSAAGEKALQTIAKHGANALGEGFEESLEAALDPLLKRATYDSGAQWDLGEIIYNGIIGAGTGLVAGSGMEAAQNGIESAARGVRDRMEQPLPLPRAKPKGQETGTPRQDVNSPEMDAMQSAWQETDSMLGSDSMRRYMTQVDLTFQGNMREGMYLRLGDTPQILRKFGAKSDNVVMTQDTARKIAYPSGYLGVKHGHNLGIPALKQLPMQVANPEAVLRSKSQPNSLVLLTKWIDKDGAPVIIALHLDKRGQLTIDNQVASAYGKRNLDALVGENGENILWTKKEDTLYPQSTGLQLPETSGDGQVASAYGKRNLDALVGENGENILWTKKEDTLYPQSTGLQLPETSGDGVPSTHSIPQADAKNKSIDQLLSNGRPMPEAMADDTLVAHSIAQTAGESKAGLTMEYGKPKAENSQAIGQAEKPGLTIAYGKPQAQETAIDTNPETHTPEQTSIEKPKTLNDRIKENRDLFEKNGTLFKPQAQETAIDTNPETHTPEQTSIEKPKTLNDRIKENRDLFEKNGTLFEMTGNEFAQSDKKLIDQVTEFFNSIGNKVFRKNFGEVALTRSGARDSISHGIGREKAIAFAAVPDVIEKGQVIDEQANWKGRRYDTVTFGGRIKIAGQDYDMGVIVKRYDNPAMASKYYVHEVMLANKEGEATTFKTGTEPAEPVGYPSDVTSPSTDSIPQTAGESKAKLTMEYGKPQATTFKTGTEPAEPVGYPSDVTSPSTDSIPQTAGESKAKLTMEYGKPQAEVPDPGILKQGDGWQAGEVKPRLGGEHEVRPENVQKIILEENPEMMQALGEAQGRAQEELIKLSGQQMPKIAIGDKVRARGLRNLGTIIGLNADGTYEVEFHNKQTGANKVVTMPAEAFEKVRARGLRNLGTIIGLNADGTYEVEFHNKQTGANKVVTMPAEAFETIRRKKLPPDAKSVQRAQEQQEALESDSYEIPDIVEQEERAVRAAQNAEDAKDQLEALEGPRTDAADAAYERTRATYADMVAEEALLRANRIAANHPVREAAARSSVHPMDVNAPDAAGAIEITRQFEGMRQTLGRLQHQFKLTKADLVTAEELAKGRTPTREVSPEKLEKITSYAKLLGEYKTAMQPFYEYKTQLDTSRKNAADALIRNSENWKDAKMGVSLSAKTPERVIEAVTGNDATEVNDALIRPVHAHNAERMRYENDHRDMLREAVKGTTREESTWVAMLNYAEYLERTGKDSSKLRVAMDKYYEKNKKHIRPARAKQLERDLIAIMNSLYPDQNETRIRNGYEPLEYMKKYLPARTRIDEGGRVAKFLRKALGIETKADELPTEIAGTTANRRPGQPYQPYAEHRVGDTDKVQIKDFDAVRAVDDYISFAGREIFFTEDIQNIRTFEERLRYRFSDEGTRAELDSLDGDYTMDPNERLKAKMEIWERDQYRTFEERLRYRFSDEGTRAELDSLDGDYTMDPNERLKAKMEIWERDQYSLPHFPTWLRKYADMLAGKKQLTDRSAEEQTGRAMYRAVSDAEAKAAVNLTGFNISTALNNLVAMQQGGAEVSAKSMARAALNYARSLTGDGDFDARSTFLANRHGTDRVWKTNLQKVQDIGGKPMEWVDHFTAGILTRGRYYDNVRAGLNAEQAMKEADDWAARVIGDRSVGARPMLFESKNPLVKAVTMFQLEPANTISHWVHDIPRSMSVGAAVGTFAKLFLTAYLFNDTMEKITGVRPAPDPAGLINSMVGRFTGWMLPNTIDMALELVRGDLDEEDFQTEKPELGDAILETAQDVASEVPFISGPLGAVFGAGNARMPIESAMPDLVKLTKALTGEGTRESKIVTAVDELSKPALAIGLPMGGGQLRKTVRGLNAAYNSGVYGYDKEGKRELKFPLYGEGNKALRAAQAAVFGPYATGRGREYVRSGFQSSLNAKETRAYDTLRNQFGVEPSAAYDGVRAVQAVDEMSTYERGGTKKGAKRNAIMALDISADAKKYLDTCLIGTSYDIPSYENETDFAITRSVTGKMQEAALSLAHEDGLSADAVIKYVLLCKTSSGENEIENKAGQMVDICTDLIGAEDLTDAQRRAVTEKLLIPQMGDKWNGEAAKTWLSGMDPTDIVYTKFRMDQIDAEVDDDATIRKLDKADHKRAKKDALIDELGLDFKAEQGTKFRMDQIDAEVDDDATIRKLDKADHKRAKKDALIDELGLDFKAEQGLRYFLGDAKGWDWEWSDIGRDGSEDERELAWELEQTGMDVVTYEIIKAGVGRQKGVEGERYSKKKKVIAYLNEWDLPQNQKDLILKMTSTYDDYKIGRGGSGKSSGGKSTGMQQPQRLKTLKPFSLPF